MIKLKEVKRNDEVLGCMTTMSTRSHYGQPVWEDYGLDVDVGNVFTILDESGGPAWKAKVLFVDPEDAWLLCEAEGCDAPCYALHLNLGVVCTVHPHEDEGNINLDPADAVSLAQTGKLRASGTIHMSEVGMGCMLDI